MKQHDIKKYFSVLLAIMIAILAGCLVILLVFRTQLLVNGAARILSILMPFIYGAVIAYLLHPLCRFLERRLLSLTRKIRGHDCPGITRMLSILLSMAIILAVITLLIIIVIPQIIASISSILNRLPGVMADFQSWLITLDQSDASHELVVYINQIATTLTNHLQHYLETDLLPDMQTAITEITSSFLNLFQVIKNFGIGCIVAAYFLGSWEKFIGQAKLVIYSLFSRQTADWIRAEAHFANRMFNGFLVGTLLDSCLIGFICFLFTSIAGTPYGMLISIIVGFTNMIPFFGPYLGLIPSALLILTVSPSACLIFVIFIIVLQQIDGNIIAPRILGNKVGLSGFWVLFAILFFGSLWGLPGMLVGVPLFAVIYDLLERMVRTGLVKRGHTGVLEDYQSRFPEEPEKEKPAGKSRLELLLKKITGGRK